MGQFVTYFYVGKKWQTTKPRLRKASLSIEIHDSDIATVEYAPSGRGAGRFYVGVHPRDYFGDSSAGDSVNEEAEVDGIASWASVVTQTKPDRDRLLTLIAKEGDEAEPEFVFVEEAVGALLRELGVAVPTELEPQT